MTTTPEQPATTLRERSPDLFDALRANVGNRVQGIARHVGVQCDDAERLLHDLDTSPNGSVIVTEHERAALVTVLTLLRTAEHVLDNETASLRRHEP